MQVLSLPLSPTPSADWCADTGASSHMTPHKEWFATYTPHVIPVRVADGNIIFSAGVGVVQFKPILGGGAPGRVVEFKRVLHVPQLNRPLLSITTLTLSENYEFLMKGAYAPVPPQWFCRIFGPSCPQSPHPPWFHSCAPSPSFCQQHHCCPHGYCPLA